MFLIGGIFLSCILETPDLAFSYHLESVAITGVCLTVKSRVVSWQLLAFHCHPFSLTVTDVNKEKKLIFLLNLYTKDTFIGNVVLSSPKPSAFNVVNSCTYT